MKGARSVLINITGGMDMTLLEVDKAAGRIRDEVDAEANIIFGSTLDQNLEGRIRVSVVATGCRTVEARRSQIPGLGHAVDVITRIWAVFRRKAADPAQEVQADEAAAAAPDLPPTPEPGPAAQAPASDEDGADNVVDTPDHPPALEADVAAPIPISDRDKALLAFLDAEGLDGQSGADQETQEQASSSLPAASFGLGQAGKRSRPEVMAQDHAVQSLPDTTHSAHAGSHPAD